jgi:dTMP kinase
MFIALEGGEGVGKTTLANGLRAEFEKRGRRVCLTREPGGCASAEAIRGLLLNGGHGWNVRTETLLLMAARAEHVEHTIRPALERGEVVLCDRFVLSTLVYQGVVGGVPMDTILKLHLWATDALKIDATLVLNTPPEVALERVKERDLPADHFSAKGLEYHAKVYRAFTHLSRQRGNEHCFLLDATKRPSEVLAQALNILQVR